MKSATPLIESGVGAAIVWLRATDANDDNQVDISDGILMLSALFLGGLEVKAPGPFACGADPTPGAIDCEAYAHCQ